MNNNPFFNGLFNLPLVGRHFVPLFQADHVNFPGPEPSGSEGNINGNVTPDNPGTDGGINIAGASAYDPLTDTTGGSLMNDHPIGFNYSEVSAIDPKIRDKEEGLSNSYGNKIQRISDVLFKGDFFTCSTCHDVHNSPAKTATNQKYLLYATADSSKNCLICHKI